MIKRSQITIISQDLPPVIVRKPNQETENLLSFIIFSDFFDNFVNAFVGENDIKPINIRPILNKISKAVNYSTLLSRTEAIKVLDKAKDLWFKLDSGIYEFHKKELKEFAALMDLPDDLAWNIFLLIRYRVFTEIDKENYPFIKYLPTESDIIREYDRLGEFEVASALWFEHKVTKSEFIEWINKNWEDIETEMEEYLPQSPIIKTDFGNLKLTYQIYRLYKSGKSPKDILGILSKKYLKNLEIYDQLSVEFIKNKISRFKRLLGKKIYKVNQRVIKKKDSITIIHSD